MNVGVKKGSNHYLFGVKFKTKTETELYKTTQNIKLQYVNIWHHKLQDEGSRREFQLHEAIHILSEIDLGIGIDIVVTRW